jgi:hypothetical protein
MSCPREVLACEAKRLQQTLARYVGTGEATYVRVPTGDFTNKHPHQRPPRAPHMWPWAWRPHKMMIHAVANCSPARAVGRHP